MLMDVEELAAGYLARREGPPPPPAAAAAAAAARGRRGKGKRREGKAAEDVTTEAGGQEEEEEEEEEKWFGAGERASVRAALLRWYRAERRRLPWRGDSLGAEAGDAREDCTVSAYGTWVSEVMAQQTRVDVVIGYWLRWMQAFPTVHALAEASEEEVNRLWAGLGYYRRAALLHKGAKMVVESFGGELPRTVEQLRTIPGIGEYTAGAIASIAFKVNAPVVDGNVIRVVSRMRALPWEAKSPALARLVWSIATPLVDPDAPGEFNQAVMELGASHCSPQSPNCAACPVAAHCWAKRLTECRLKYEEPGEAPSEGCGAKHQKKKGRGTTSNNNNSQPQQQAKAPASRLISSYFAAATSSLSSTSSSRASVVSKTNPAALGRQEEEQPEQEQEQEQEQVQEEEKEPDVHTVEAPPAEQRTQQPQPPPLPDTCPILAAQLALLPTSVTEFPRKTEKVAPTPRYMAVTVCVAAPHSATATPMTAAPDSARFLLIRRPATGLLARQWEFPALEVGDWEREKTTTATTSRPTTQELQRLPPQFAWHGFHPQSQDQMAAANGWMPANEWLRDDLRIAPRPDDSTAAFVVRQCISHVFSHRHHVYVVRSIVGQFDNASASPSATASSLHPLSWTTTTSGREARWMTLQDMQNVGITAGMRKVLHAAVRDGAVHSQVLAPLVTDPFCSSTKAKRAAPPLSSSSSRADLKRNRQSK